jgi:hypothetical protein
LDIPRGGGFIELKVEIGNRSDKVVKNIAVRKPYVEHREKDMSK